MKENKKDFIGISHVNAMYYFGDDSYLVEGAKKILDLGFSTIKIFICSRYREYYRHNATWENYSSPTELVQSRLFKEVLDMDFSCIILETYSYRTDNLDVLGYWDEALSEDQKKIEYDTMYELTSYILEAYKETQKTFIFQNWESDWSLLGETNPDILPTDHAIANCIDWTNIRQDAVNHAKSIFTGSGVEVYHALEVNLVKKAMEGKKCATNDVIPFTYCDFYSYSSYDTSVEGACFEKALDYLLKIIGTNKNSGKSQLYIGEFGIPENEFTHKQIEVSLKTVIEISKKKNLPYVVYWQLYDNEAIMGKNDEPGDCRGFWLIKPSGTKSFALTLLKNNFI